MKPNAHFLLGSMLVLAGCATPTSELSLQQLYDQTQTEAEDSPQELEARLQRVRELLAVAPSGEDRLFAAVVLLDSTDFIDLDRARDLALTAAEAGDERGFRIAAEAIDLARMLDNRPQRYGTQYVYSPATEDWYLYQWDPTTTDAERAAMGVPSLAESLSRIEALNAQQ